MEKCGSNPSLTLFCLSLLPCLPSCLLPLSSYISRTHRPNLPSFDPSSRTWKNDARRNKVRMCLKLR